MKGQRLVFLIIAVMVITVMVLQTCMVQGPPGPVGFLPSDNAGSVVTDPAVASSPSPSLPTHQPVTPSVDQAPLPVGPDHGRPPGAAPTGTASEERATTVASAVTPSATATAVVPTPTPSPTFDGAIPVPPRRDPYDLAVRYKPAARNAPILTAVPTPVPRKVGDRETFWVADQNRRTYFTIVAELVSITDHAYFYVQDGLRVDPAGVRTAAEFFEQKTYPTLTRYLRPQWRPRINGDPRVTILNARVPGVGGYFSTADAYPRSVNERSNEREMIYVNMDSVAPGTTGYNATVAHEFTHLIQWHLDENEETWINEGSAELGAQAVGAPPSGGSSVFLANPDLQLTAWRDSGGGQIAHYGAAYLFLRYLLDHYGGYETLGELLADDADGIAGINRFLARRDPARTFDDVFRDWTIANLINDATVAGGRYSYQRPGIRPPTERAPVLGAVHAGTVRQFAARYYDVPLPDDDVRLFFTGTQQVQLVPVDAHSGHHQWWSNRGDGIDARLTRRLDLRQTQRPVLRFALWYDIERDFDYGYVAVSTDDGRTWQTLPGKHTTTANPNGTNLGHGYTARSGPGATPAWMDEEIDLSAYAGREVLLRFEYVTDDAYNVEGFGIDDIRVAETGFADDAETADGWQAEGFARIVNRVPQRYAVEVIEDGAPVTVRTFAIGPDGLGSLVLPKRDALRQRATIVVSGLTPHTLQAAPFALSLARSGP